MNIGLPNRAQLEKIPGGHWVVDSLNKLLIAITGSYHTQHNTDDTHGAVTATSVFAGTMGGPSSSAGKFTQQTGYGSPIAARWIFGDNSGWQLAWSRWASTSAASTRSPVVANLVDVMTLTDQGVLAPVSVSGPSGVLGLTTTAPAVGGGAAATLSTIGGSGPSTAAQHGWVKVTLNGTTAYLPYWT